MSKVHFESRGSMMSYLEFSLSKNDIFPLSYSSIGTFSGKLV